VSGRLEGKVALVTGAGLGIGRATCLRLAEEGAEVIATSRTLAHAEATCEQVADATGRHLTALEMDVVDTRAVEATVERAAARHGRLDIAVANAGQGLPRAPSLAETTDEEWNRLFAVNVQGVFSTVRAALKHMARGGSVVTVASINSFSAYENDGVYTATKGAVLQFTRALALDVVARGIRANAVCPGIIDTPLTQEFLERAADPEALRAQYEAVAPMNRMGTAREVANCIVFLASDEASFVTGAALVVDGGTLVRI
jgi:NAD(P)-dependent dehydrogenase (short-subunit alcohol dehydrogenase family)